MVSIVYVRCRAGGEANGPVGHAGGHAAVCAKWQLQQRMIVCAVWVSLHTGERHAFRSLVHITCGLVIAGALGCNICPRLPAAVPRNVSRLHLITRHRPVERLSIDFALNLDLNQVARRLGRRQVHVGGRSNVCGATFPR